MFLWPLNDTVKPVKKEPWKAESSLKQKTYIVLAKKKKNLYLLGHKPV